MTGTDMIGGPAVWISRPRLWWAADAVIEGLGRQVAGKLRVRSGEHLAAILTTAFLRTPPTGSDLDGGVDLRFDVTRPGDHTNILPAGTTEAAFEVKSLPGAFREFDSALDRDLARGLEPGQPRLDIAVVGASDVMREAGVCVTKAAGQLSRKVAPGTSRNIFLVVHSFDYMAVECFSPGADPGINPIRARPKVCRSEDSTPAPAWVRTSASTCCRSEARTGGRPQRPATPEHAGERRSRPARRSRSGGPMSCSRVHCRRAGSYRQCFCRPAVALVQTTFMLAAVPAF
jgi:hypothetical protein